MVPAFVLGSVAGFVSILLGRLTAVVDRIRSLNDISEDDDSRVHLKSDLPRLRRRAELLRNAAHLAIFSGMGVGLLLIAGFVCAYLRLEHIYGAALLFVFGVALLVAVLFRFGQEVCIGLSEADHYRRTLGWEGLVARQAAVWPPVRRIDGDIAGNRATSRTQRRTGP